MEEGILAGSGLTIFRLGLEMVAVNEVFSRLSREAKTARRILGNAMQTPLMQICENAGKTDYFKDYIQTSNKMTATKRWGYGYNVKTGEYGNLIKMGVIDPAKVTRCALENAVSVAVTILSTNAIITFDESNR